MVRTKADNAGRKAVAAKAPRKILGGASGSSSGPSSSSSGGDYSGTNPVCVRPTPDWQKKIDSFFKKAPIDENSKDQTEQEVSEQGGGSAETGGSSSQGSGSPSHSNTSSPTPKRRRPVIESDEED